MWRRQTKNVQLVLCAHINFAVGNHRRGKLDSRTECVAPGNHCAVVKLSRQIGSIVSMQDGRSRDAETAVVQDPDDAMDSAIGGDARGAARKAEDVRAL